jgi:hypothetical protein
MSGKELHKPLGFQSQANLLTYLLFSNSCNEEKINTGRVNCMEKEMQAALLSWDDISMFYFFMQIGGKIPESGRRDLNLTTYMCTKMAHNKKESAPGTKKSYRIT